MHRKTVVLILIIFLFVMYWLYYPNLQLLYFSRHRAVSNEDLQLYNSDKSALSDTIIYWDDLWFSPVAFKPKHWWIDTIIYNGNKDRLLLIVNVHSDPQGEMPFNFSQSILGHRKNNNLSFLAAGGTQYMKLIDPGDSSKEVLSHIGRRELMIYLYYPCTVIQRKNLWSALFNQEDVMIKNQEREIEKWKKTKSEQDHPDE